jgi:hypothetical protein
LVPCFANTGRIVVAALTTNDVDDAFRIRPLLDQIEGPVASFASDAAYDSVYRSVTERDPDAAVIGPPCSLRRRARRPTRRDCHLRFIDETGRLVWQEGVGLQQA